MKKIIFAMVFALACSALFADIKEDARKAMDVIGQSVVSAEAVLEVSYGYDGSSSPSEVKMREMATVVDDSGLLVVPISLVSAPDDEDVQSSTLKSLKVRMADGKQIDAEVAVKDTDLGIAVIKLKEASGVKAAVPAKGAKAEVFETMLRPERLGSFADYALAISFDTVISVLKKPRTLYIFDKSDMDYQGGTPIFTPEGKLFGMSVSMKIGGKDEYVLNCVLPVDDLLTLTEQAKQ